MSGDQTRRELLVRGGVGAAGLTSAAILGSGVSEATAAATSPATTFQIDRLERLIDVEQLLLFCYDAVLSSRVSGPRMHHALRPLRAQELAHIAALTHQLRLRGGTPPPPPTGLEVANDRLSHRKIGGRLGQLKGAKDALRLLLTLEQATVGAYYVALTLLDDVQLIKLITQIMANDAQHETMINLQLNNGNAAVSVPYGLVQGLQ
ncbi:MAG: ferritin-like domain-containing protein [Solirubrobacteraceae bacterium]